MLVIGGRYGSIDETGISYTEKEFDYALGKGKPVLAFIHEKPDEIPFGKTDKSDALRERLNQFIERVKTSGRHIKYWNNADDLKAKVILAIAAETKRNPREGWIRSNGAADPAVVEALRQQLDQLKSELNLARNAPPAGAEKYQSGESIFECGLYFYKGMQRSSAKIKVTWDDIFFEVGPILMDEASEQQMQNRLGSELWRYEPETFQGSSNISLENDSFETIKVQLVALGLIQKGSKKHVPSDTNRYWTLTPFGETKLMQLRAILKTD